MQNNEVCILNKCNQLEYIFYPLHNEIKSTSWSIAQHCLLVSSLGLMMWSFHVVRHYTARKNCWECCYIGPRNLPRILLVNPSMKQSWQSLDTSTKQKGEPCWRQQSWVDLKFCNLWMITQQASLIFSMWMSQHDRALVLNSRKVSFFPQCIISWCC